MNQGAKQSRCRVCSSELSSLLGMCPCCLTEAGSKKEPDAYQIAASQVADDERKTLILLARTDRQLRSLRLCAGAIIALLVIIAALLAVIALPVLAQLSGVAG